MAKRDVRQNLYDDHTAAAIHAVSLTDELFARRGLFARYP